MPKKTQIRTINKGILSKQTRVMLVPFLDGERPEQAIKRLDAEGYIFHEVADIARCFAEGVMLDDLYGCRAVVALGKKSRFTHKGSIEVACVYTGGDGHRRLAWAWEGFDSKHLILVSKKEL